MIKLKKALLGVGLLDFPYFVLVSLVDHRWHQRWSHLPSPSTTNRKDLTGKDFGVGLLSRFDT